MTTPGSEGVLRRAAEAAALAPSIHNTQPWQFEIGESSINVIADLDRSLTVLDPTHRQLIVSIGCAVFNARVALAADGAGASVALTPDPANAALIATITLTDDGPEPDLAIYEPVLATRRTNRRDFTDEPVPFEVVDALEKAAQAEDAILMPIYQEELRLEIARLSQKANDIQETTPEYHEELQKWITSELGRRDGIPMEAVPHGGQAQDEVPIRQFDTVGGGGLPGQTHSSHNQMLFLLGTVEDDAASWVRAGQALERVQLEVARLEYAISPLTQVVEVPETREQLRRELQNRMWPDLLLRVGKAEPTPAIPRRDASEVITNKT